MNDWRVAWRRLAREPSFTLLAVVALALGLGANIALFALVEGVLLRPLGYQAPQQLYSVREVIPAAARQFPTLPVNFASFDAWRRSATSFSGFALIHPAALDLASSRTRGATRQIVVDQVSANLFTLLGVTPALGRGFEKDSDTAGRNREVILTDGFWRAQFGGDPAAVGRTVVLNGAECTVIGVLPADFHFPAGSLWGTFVAAAAAGGVPQMFQPLVVDAARRQAAGSFDFGLLARLRPGVAPAAAQHQLDGITSHLMAAAGAARLQVHTRLTPLRAQVTAAAAQSLWLLWAAMLAVLALVCVNLGSLMLARAQAQMPDMAVRLALGASDWRLLRPPVVEAILLAAAGGVAGWVLAAAGLRFWLAAAPSDFPRRAGVHLDAVAGLFGVGLALLTALVCAAAPAWRAWRSGLQATLHAASPRLASRSRARHGLIGLEAAMAAVLLVLTGLLLHSFIRLQQVAPGYSANPKLIVATDLAGPDAARRGFWAASLPRVRALPGVAAAGLTTELPLQGVGVTEQVYLRGDSRSQAERPIVNVQFISPDYFRAMGIPVRGREFQPADSQPDAPPVVILSATSARRLFPHRDALGQRLRLAAPASPEATVVGVSADVRTDLRHAPGPMVFQPLSQDLSRHLAYLVIATRPGITPLALAPEVRATLARVEPRAAVPLAESMAQVRAGVVANQHLELTLALGFGAGALALAALGIYGVTTFALAQHRPELAVRAALGAEPRRLAVWVLRQGLLPVLAGLAAGLIGAVLLARLLAAQWFGVGPTDPWALLGSAAAVLAAALIASAWPARRAAHLDPWRELKS